MQTLFEFLLKPPTCVVVGTYSLLACSALIWIFLRILLFLEPRMDSLTLPPDILQIAVFFHRIILIGIAFILLYFMFPWVVMNIFIAHAFHANAGDIPAMITLGGLSLYYLSSIILNFPAFPLALHQKLFLPAHLSLLPCLAFITFPIIFLLLGICVTVYALFWKWNLKERMELTYKSSR